MLKILEHERDFDDFLVANQNKLVLVKFSAVWCPPCQLLKKNIEELLIELQQSFGSQKELILLEIDVDKFSSLTQRPQFNVYSIPAIFLFFQGKMIRKNNGNLSVFQLKEFIKI
ncbi:MAG: Thioredoxin-like protein [Mycoplasmataceae bacterium]|nr:MAG: Thioredoxin-like protein [Mycoplasmataceae bacterium]